MRDQRWRDDGEHMGDYAIRGGEAGRRRLDLLARIMAPATAALLERAGVRSGMRCLDLGCGGGQVSLMLARRVGDGGRVVGLDLDAVKIEAARADAAMAAQGNVEFRCGEIDCWSEVAAYDVVYARFIFSHLRDPARVLARVAAALKPGGVVVAEDVDFGGAFCHPERAAYRRYCEWYRAVVARRGGDADLGRKLYGMCLVAVFDGAHLQVVQPAPAGAGEDKGLQAVTLANIAEAIVADGLATAQEVALTVVELERLAADPRSIIALPRVFQVWAQAPGAGRI
jgi:SAM-dependent methyltransferase